MKILEFILNVGANIVAGIVVFILGYFSSMLPSLFVYIKLRHFFREKVINNKLLIVQGSYTRITGSTILLKDYQRKDPKKVGGPKELIASGDVDSTLYIIQELAKYNKGYVSVISDKKAQENILGTFILIMRITS